MPTEQLALAAKTVRKSNALARARWSPDSIWEPRLVAMVAANIKTTDSDFKTYEIRISDLIGESSRGGKNYKDLEKVVDKAMSRIITIRTEAGWRKYTLFASCELDTRKGVLKVGFHPDLRDHYLQLKQYMQYNLVEFMVLPSVYSQRIFEFLKSWDDRKEVVISLEELHEMLDTPKSFRASYKDFRRFVLEKAHEDILKHTKLNYKWEAIKKGRAVNEIKFVFLKASPKKPVAAAAARQIEETPQQRPAYVLFMAKFPGDSQRVEAGRLWFKLKEMGKAPQAEDVPEDNELSLLEFLNAWQEKVKA